MRKVVGVNGVVQREGSVISRPTTVVILSDSPVPQSPIVSHSLVRVNDKVGHAERVKLCTCGQAVVSSAHCLSASECECTLVTLSGLTNEHIRG